MGAGSNDDNEGVLRRVLRSSGIAVIIISSVVAGCWIFFRLWIEPIYAESANPAYSFSEGIGFAGVLITILAFISAFYILLLAIDAFKISADVAKNADSIKSNMEMAESLKEQISALSARVADEEERLALLRADAVLSSDIFREINESSDDTSEVLRLLDRIGRALELSAKAHIDPDEEVVRRILAYATGMKSKIPPLIENNVARQARISVLSQLVSEPVATEDRVLQRALFLLREEAGAGDASAKSLIERFEAVKKS